MNVTESRFKNRQLHIEDYLQMVSAEQKEYAEVFDEAVKNLVSLESESF